MTTSIRLKGGGIALVDDQDAPQILNYRWYLHSVGPNRYARGYKKGNRKGGLLYMHRLVLAAAPDQEVDHINGDGLDNRRANLRICSRSQNNMNRLLKSPGKTSRFKGVYRSGSRWAAELTLNHKRYRLGRFASETEAALAYAEKAAELFGEFASEVRVPLESEHARERPDFQRSGAFRVDGGER